MKLIVKHLEFNENHPQGEDYGVGVKGKTHVIPLTSLKEDENGVQQPSTELLTLTEVFWENARIPVPSMHKPEELEWLFDADDIEEDEEDEINEDEVETELVAPIKTDEIIKSDEINKVETKTATT